MADLPEILDKESVEMPTSKIDMLSKPDTAATAGQHNTTQYTDTHHGISNKFSKQDFNAAEHTTKELLHTGKAKASHSQAANRFTSISGQRVCESSTIYPFCPDNQRLCNTVNSEIGNCLLYEQLLQQGSTQTAKGTEMHTAGNCLSTTQDYFTGKTEAVTNRATNHNHLISSQQVCIIPPVSCDFNKRIHDTADCPIILSNVTAEGLLHTRDTTADGISAQLPLGSLDVIVGTHERAKASVSPEVRPNLTLSKKRKQITDTNPSASIAHDVLEFSGVTTAIKNLNDVHSQAACNIAPTKAEAVGFLYQTTPSSAVNARPINAAQQGHSRVSKKTSWSCNISSPVSGELDLISSDNVIRKKSQKRFNFKARARIPKNSRSAIAASESTEDSSNDAIIPNNVAAITGVLKTNIENDRDAVLYVKRQRISSHDEIGANTVVKPLVSHETTL